VPPTSQQNCGAVEIKTYFKAFGNRYSSSKYVEALWRKTQNFQLTEAVWSIKKYSKTGNT